MVWGLGTAWNWTGRKPTARRANAFADTVPGPSDSVAPSTGSPRYEVCPPSLLDDDFTSTRSGLRSLLPRLDSVRDWLQTGWVASDLGDTPRQARHSAAAGSRLTRARGAALAALDGIDDAAGRGLAARAASAAGLRELWHLRNELFTLVAIRHCESVAHQRLAELNACFPIRSQRTPAPGQRRDIGLPSSRQEFRP